MTDAPETFWAAQAQHWHSKYKELETVERNLNIAIEALERIAKGDGKAGVTRERLCHIAKYALEKMEQVDE